MSMHRRPVGRPKVTAVIGAIVTLVGCVLPWWTVGGGADAITQLSGNAFDSSGILVFIAALATIALVTLPYARERPVRVDRWMSYAVIAVVGWLAFLYRIADLFLASALSFDQPLEIITRSPGMWLTAIGLIVIGRAIYDMRRLPSAS